MLSLVSRSWLAVVLLVMVVPALAQRDRDTYTGSSQTFEVGGMVRLAETGTTAQNIQVRLERFGGGLVDQIPTDSQGRFRFPNLQRGYYRVIINTPGYSPAQQDADLQVLFRIFLAFNLVSDRPATPASSYVIDAKAPPAAREAFARGSSALAKKNYDEAIHNLQRATEVYPGFLEAEFLLSEAFLDQRSWKEAEASLQRARKLKPDSAPTLISLGEVYWRQQRFDEAEKVLQEGLKIDDKSWHGYFTLGRLYWDQGEIGKAAPQIGRTLQLKPDFAEAHLLAGNILLRLREQKRAVLEYQEYLRLAPKGEFASQARELIEKIKSAPNQDKKN
ncbi:MAG: protein O-GlcNAc transferase [Blastocatellia bacterium]|jgi:tetratricopeptide (TPR) repeat protein|nr:protein O-GlcNAc transferase [Blastocatellia bacterium]